MTASSVHEILRNLYTPGGERNDLPKVVYIMGFTEDEFAQIAVVIHLLDRNMARVESAGFTHQKLQLLLFHKLDNIQRVFKTCHHGLGDNHMFSHIQGMHDMLCMEVIGGKDDNDIDVILLYKFFVIIGCEGDAAFLADARYLVQAGAAKPPNFKTGVGFIVQVEQIETHSDPDDTDTNILIHDALLFTCKLKGWKRIINAFFIFVKFI